LRLPQDADTCGQRPSLRAAVPRPISPPGRVDNITWFISGTSLAFSAAGYSTRVLIHRLFGRTSIRALLPELPTSPPDVAEMSADIPQQSRNRIADIHGHHVGRHPWRDVLRTSFRDVYQRLCRPLSEPPIDDSSIFLRELGNVVA
jgi:hypothetical protein